MPGRTRTEIISVPSDSAIGAGMTVENMVKSWAKPRLPPMENAPTHQHHDNSGAEVINHRVPMGKNTATFVIEVVHRAGAK